MVRARSLFTIFNYIILIIIIRLIEPFNRYAEGTQLRVHSN